jgi:hypothetical protein
MDLFSFILGFATAIGMFLLIIYWPETKRFCSIVVDNVYYMLQDVIWFVRERIRK